MAQISLPVEETITYDSGLTVSLRTHASTARDEDRLNYDQMSSFLLITNVGAGGFYKPIKESKPLVSGETFIEPGMCFRTLGNGQLIEAFAPCCWSTFSKSTVSRRRRQYVACSKCRNPFVPSPMIMNASLSRSPRAQRFQYSDFPTFSENWATTFVDAMEGVLWSADLLKAFEYFTESSRNYRELLEAHDKKERKKARELEKARHEEKIITKFLDRIDSDLCAKNKLPQKYMKMLRDNARVDQ